MQYYDVWMESFPPNTGPNFVQYLGRYEAGTFSHACKQAIVARDWSPQFYDPIDNTYWGCRFYDNEEDVKSIIVETIGKAKTQRKRMMFLKNAIALLLIVLFVGVCIGVGEYIMAVGIAAGVCLGFLLD